ncbi:hypothetical protein MLD38_034462, partial [Melastoma candidum]
EGLGQGWGAARQRSRVGSVEAAPGGGEPHKRGIDYVERELVQESCYLQTRRDVRPVQRDVRSSPRFNKYGNEFGMGKALVARSGYTNKFDCKVTAYPGREGGGSIDLEICLPAATMAALENDAELMAAVTV